MKLADRVVRCTRQGSGLRFVARQSIGALDGANGDVCEETRVMHKDQKQKQRERETGTNLVKMPLRVNKAVTAITWAPIKD
jgi:hypothetical protein